MPERVEQARAALAAIPWWRIFKRQDAANEYLWALYAAAIREMDDVPNAEREGQAVLDELRAIRGLLEERAAQQATCPHGSVGVCMDCLLPIFDHLGVTIANQHWEATRRGH